MNITCLHPEDLAAQHISAWENLQSSEPSYSSPFFSPHFTLAVSAVRLDVRVAVIEATGSMGFFPFQSDGRGAGYAVGWGLNDFQSAILSEGLDVDTRLLLRASGLRSWRFDHLVSTCRMPQSCLIDWQPSPVIDLQGGFEAYCSRRSDAGSEIIKKTFQAERRLRRDVGDVRLILDSEDDEVMIQLATWKTAQLRQMGSIGLFDVPWIRHVVERVRHLRVDGCRGQLSALYAGENLVAAHLGLRSRNTMHWWITAYSSDFERYSPGAILLLRLAEGVALENVVRIDLGKGNEAYKQRFMSNATLVGQGVVCSSRIRQWWQGKLQWTRSIVRASPLGPMARAIKRFRNAHRHPIESR